MSSKRSADQPLEPWDRQIGESPQAYAAFVAYRDMGAARSTAKVARQLSKTKQLMTGWSSQWSWVERCRAWDVEQDRIQREAQQEALRDMARRHARLGVLLFDKVVRRLVGDDVSGIKALDPNTLNASDLAKLTEVAVKVERLARGEPTENVVQERVERERKEAIDVGKVISDSEATDLAARLFERLHGPGDGPADAGGAG